MALYAFSLNFQNTSLRPSIEHARMPTPVRHDVTVVVTSSRDKESSTPTVSVHRWRTGAQGADCDGGQEDALHRQDSAPSKRIHDESTSARRRCEYRAVLPSFYLPDHHIAEALGRKLTLCSCCARISSTLRVARLAVVSVVAGG